MNESKSTSCPKCGAVDVIDGARRWCCGSYLNITGEVQQSDKCRLVCCERERQALESLVADLEAKLELAKSGLQSADCWFARFGYNGYGVVMCDDLPDHEEPMKAVKAALAEIEKGEAQERGAT